MWESELTLIVRNIIGDTDSSSYSYSDSRIQEVIITCARLVSNELTFDSTYTISVTNLTISPDPVDDNDKNFITLVCLKTACFLMTSEYRTKSLNSGFIIKDGPHSIDTKGMLAGIKDTRDSICKQYDDAKYQFQTSGSVLNAISISTPYSPGSYFLRG